MLGSEDTQIMDEQQKRKILDVDSTTVRPNGPALDVEDEEISESESMETDIEANQPLSMAVTDFLTTIRQFMDSKHSIQENA